MARDEIPSSPPNPTSSTENALAYYKTQYEQLESELADFQASSKELEAELEKDVEASEKRERTLQQKVEGLGFEVDEWKSKYKQSKNEASTAQSSLQKEITTLRESNRSMQLRLRDIEVANDDFERQARNTTSSLEDMESKYNQAIERAVMLEAEVQSGEQEREGLRIEAQRLREEFSDLKIEAEITQEKLNRMKSETRVRPSSHDLPNGVGQPHSPTRSPTTATSSPTASTPPRPKSASTTVSEATPPSPPISDASGGANAAPKVQRSMPKLRSGGGDNSVTPRPSNAHSKPQSRTPSGIAIPSVNTRRPKPRQSEIGPPNLPSSGSLRQIRGLIGQMQKLEQRVHSARSKLPAPVHTPERASPRNGSALGDHHIPSSVTVRSSKRRTGGSNISAMSSIAGREDTEVTPLSTKHVNRLSFGGPPRPPSAAAGEKSTGGTSRPSSRTSISSRSSISHQFQRPSSRASLSGARTPLGHYTSSTAMEGRRPRSSMGGSYTSSHGHHGSVSYSKHDNGDATTPTPRRTTFSKADGPPTTGIPTPTGIPRRQSGGAALASNPGGGGRRTSSGAVHHHESNDREMMGPPERRRKLSGVGETY